MKKTNIKRIGTGLVFLAPLVFLITGPGQVTAKKKKKKARHEITWPAEMDEDFGDLREEIQAEWAQRKEEIEAEIEAERREILRLYRDEQKAIKAIWGTMPPPSSLEQYRLDPAFKSEVSYKDGKLKATSVVVADSPADVKEAEKKCQQHASQVLDQEIKSLKPTNGPSVAEELKRPDSKLEEKNLDQFVTSSGTAKVEGIVDLPEGKKGVKVSVEVPIADPEKPSLTQVLEPMLAEPESDVQEVKPSLPPPPAEPPFDTEAWLKTQGPINGLIVDTRGTGFEPCVYPRVMGGDNSGNVEVVYYTGSLSDSLAGKLGLSGWARSVDAARTEPRLTPGKKYPGSPLTIESREVIQILDNKIMLGPTGAAKIKASDEKYLYLNCARVVLVVD